MTLTQLRYFRALAQIGNYHRAAEKLYISQPALSRTITQLEKELNLALFEKSGRSVILTAGGQVFLRYVEQALDSLDKAVEETRSFADNENRISIGCVSTAVSPYLAPMLQEYKTTLEIPIRYRTWTEPSEELIEGLFAGRYDVIFCSRIDGIRGLCFVPVCEQPLYVVVRRDDPLAAQKAVRPQELDGRSMLFTESKAYSNMLRKMLADYNVRMTVSGLSNEETALLGMVEAGIGCFITNDYPQVHSENTVLIPLEQNRCHRYIWMAYLENKSQTPIVQSLIDFNAARAITIQ